MPKPMPTEGEFKFIEYSAVTELLEIVELLRVALKKHHTSWTCESDEHCSAECAQLCIAIATTSARLDSLGALK